MADIFERRLANLGPLGQYSDKVHGYFAFPYLEGEIGPHMKFQGKEMLNWSLNNYLGLANHPEVRQTDAEAAAQWGMAAPMGARMMSGQTPYHEELERQLAEFVQKEDAFLLNFGYQGVMSTIEAIVDYKDVIVYDAESHACLIDGIRLHKAKMGKYFTFKHNDMESLEKNLQRATKLADEQGGGVLVITEGVFGMSGNIGKLDEIVALKQKYNFRLLVDDAHGFGTMGATGSGVAEHLGVQDGVDLHFSTFAKSMASIGGFIAGPKAVIQYLRYNLRSQTYAKSLPMPLVIGAMKRLELLRTRPELRQNLWNIVNAVQNGLRSRGFDIGTTQSPVTPVFLHGEHANSVVTQLVVDLRENLGIFCSIVVYPVVPKGVIMLRIIPTAVHTLEDVERTLDAFDIIQERLTSGTYADKGFAQVVKSAV
ncbi:MULTISPECIES: aminotransferase class I/II-fold pyridoxal phosphate-dependent enzyme [unclassified Siphonobacter]|uniref:aminotransferase class I/II-fold pyridoxal phosphate-dependent enzyme n=1 Tax=unclassified Siphonobacter TaxID=2635712 RepID=UPI001E47B823|nr:MULTISPECIES: aminotransferase class I/II-fold pyridoxal phosphate-dependent enzyme [unclassified Siphonobacter]